MITELVNQLVLAFKTADAACNSETILFVGSVKFSLFSIYKILMFMAAKKVTIFVANGAKSR